MAHDLIDSTSCWCLPVRWTMAAGCSTPLCSCRLPARRFQTTSRGVLALTYLAAGQHTRESFAGWAAVP